MGGWVGERGEVHREGAEQAGSQPFPWRKPGRLWSGILQLLSARRSSEKKTLCGRRVWRNQKQSKGWGSRALRQSCPRSSRSPNWLVLTQRMEAAGTEPGAQWKQWRRAHWMRTVGPV